MRKVIVAFLPFMATLLLAAPAESGNSSFVEDMLTSHNQARRTEGVNLPALRWSPALAQFAQQWADHLSHDQACDLIHRDDAHRYLQGEITGENLFAGSYSEPYAGYMWTAANVVADWVGEKADYHAVDGSCTAGQMCGHYTQVVWKQTQQVGCARARCAQAEVWVCNYLPAGNVIGEFPY